MQHVKTNNNKQRIMYKLFYRLILTTLTLTSCVSESDYKKLKQENEGLTEENEGLKTKVKQLNVRIDNLTIENRDLLEDKNKKEKKIQISSLHTEEEALRLLNDYYEFYDANFVYRNPKVRQVSENVFKISLEECSKKTASVNNGYFWESIVIKLSIYDDGKYDVIRELH
jgi:hypothetical protein